MRRMLIGSWAMIGVATSSVWAQEAVKREQEGGNWLGWFIILFGVSIVLLGFLSISRTRKIYKVAANRSLQLSEESNELARQQLVLQAETNRLLERLIAERGEG